MSPKHQMPCNCSKKNLSQACRELCKGITGPLPFVEGDPRYPILKALFQRFEIILQEEGFITEYDIIDQIAGLEPIPGVEHIPILQPLLALVVENVQPIDTDSAIVLGKTTRLMSENLMKLAFNEEQREKEGDVSRYFTEARLMQKISSDHFMHAGVLSIVGQER